MGSGRRGINAASLQTDTGNNRKAGEQCDRHWAGRNMHSYTDTARAVSMISLQGKYILETVGREDQK